MSCPRRSHTDADADATGDGNGADSTHTQRWGMRDKYPKESSPSACGGARESKKAAIARHAGVRALAPPQKTTTTSTSVTSPLDSRPKLSDR